MRVAGGIRQNSMRPFGSIFVYPVGQIIKRREDILIKTEQIWDDVSFTSRAVHPAAHFR